MFIAAAPNGNTPSNVPTGDQLLARAVNAPGLRSYSVPVTFAVHLEKPIGMRTQAEGTAYYSEPAMAALQITKATGLLGAFFRGAYKLDLVPQGWAATYHVFSVSQSTANGSQVLLLRALPRTAPGDVAQVVFTLTTPALTAVSAQWQYKDASSISLSFTNQRVGTYTLPVRATIAVARPQYRLDADAVFGTYNLNLPVPPSVFSGAK
jgi:hypothetical protein